METFNYIMGKDLINGEIRRDVINGKTLVRDKF